MGKNFGENITERLRSLGKSQKWLASEIGITECTLSRYVNNTREPRGEILFKMARALNVTAEELLGRPKMGNDFGENITERLRLMGKSQKWLASEIGMTECTLSRYVNNTREPRKETLFKIARALNVTTDELLGKQYSGSDDSYERLLLEVGAKSKYWSDDQKLRMIRILTMSEKSESRNQTNCLELLPPCRKILSMHELFFGSPYEANEKEDTHIRVQAMYYVLEMAGIDKNFFDFSWVHRAPFSATLETLLGEVDRHPDSVRDFYEDENRFNEVESKENVLAAKVLLKLGDFHGIREQSYWLNVLGAVMYISKVVVPGGSFETVDKKMNELGYGSNDLIRLAWETLHAI